MTLTWSKRGEAMLEDVRVAFLNFSGRAGKYNREGDRNFCVILDRADADILLEQGWNIKQLNPRDEEELPTPYIQVKVNFNSEWPPKAILITDRGRTNLDETTIELLDSADIKHVDVVINPSRYDVNGNTGIAAYMAKIYVTIEEDAFERKYSMVPDSAASSKIDEAFEDRGEEVY